MSTQPRPPAPGDTLPDSPLVASSGATSTLHAELGPAATLVYFMRTPTCPVCNAHLKHFARNVADFGDARVLVIVPGDDAAAGMVESRHAGAPFVVRASETAHANANLFVKVGLQQSGTFVVDAAGTVAYAKTATVPLQGYDHEGALAALAGVSARP